MMANADCWCTFSNWCGLKKTIPRVVCCFSNWYENKVNSLFLGWFGQRGGFLQTVRYRKNMLINVLDKFINKCWLINLKGIFLGKLLALVFMCLCKCGTEQAKELILFWYIFSLTLSTDGFFRELGASNFDFETVKLPN